MIHIRKAVIFPLFFIFLVVIGLYQIYVLRVAHSSFENYYRFRGCVQLLERGDSYGVCRTATGDVVRLVGVNGKWYLEGDLP